METCRKAVVVSLFHSEEVFAEASLLRFMSMATLKLKDVKKIYDGGVEADFVTVEESATIYPYVLSFGRKDIKIDPIVYELSFLDLDPSQPMDIDKNNYRISYDLA